MGEGESKTIEIWRVLVVCPEHPLLELLVRDPEDDVPGHESGEGGVKALVERERALLAAGLQRAVEGAAVATGRTIHKPEG